MLEIPDHPQRSANLRRHHGEAYPCVVCGLRVRSDNRWMVRMWWGTHVVTPQEADQLTAEGEGGGDLGYYPIGPDCLRKHPELKPYASQEKTPCPN